MPGDVPLVALATRRDVVPETILDEGSAKRPVHVPQLDQLLRRAQAGVLQGLRVVAALHGAVGAVREKRSLDRVRARARDEAHHRPADFRLAQPAGRAEDDLLGMTDVRDVERHATAADRRSDRHPIDLQPPFGERSAMIREGDRRRPGNAADILHRRRDTGDERREAEVRPPARERVDDVLLQRLLHFRALDVDERGLAGDGNGFLHRADPEIGVDRGDECACQLDALSPDAGKSGQREGHRIGAGIERHDAVLTRSVGHRRAHLLDQRRAGRFNGDAWQHRARTCPSRLRRPTPARRRRLASGARRPPA